MTSQDDVKNFANKLGSNSYTELTLLHSGTQVILQVSVYSVADGSPLWSGTYNARLLSISRTSARVSLFVGQTIAGKFDATAVNLSLVENIAGFGEVGIGASALVTEPAENSVYAAGPALSWNINEVTSSPWSWGSIALTAKSGFAWLCLVEQRKPSYYVTHLRPRGRMNVIKSREAS